MLSIRGVLLFFLMLLHYEGWAYAQTGLLFTITESGATASIDVILCLNGKESLSCQKYHVSAQNLQIRTTAKHYYPAVGIKVLTVGYYATGCTLYPNGYCLFAASNTASTAIHLNSRAKKKNQKIFFTTIASPATVGGPSYTPTATATSGLPVTITVNASSTNICSINRGIVSFIAAGTCILNGNQAGNTRYNPAPQVQQRIRVTRIGASLAISSPTLVLAQAGIFIGASGAPIAASKSRILTITNQGEGIATNLVITFNPTLSGGTTVDTTANTACTSATALAHNDFCTITLSSGTPSSIGIAPITNTMTVTASNSSNSVTSDITTLTYGSLYGDGYVFSIDDSTAPTLSVGLVKVAALSDQNPFLPWDADPVCAINPYACNYNTGAASTTNGTDLTTPSPGGNTYLIWNVLTNTAPANPPTFPEDVSAYAAGVCVSYSGGGHTDWYLPAICEMAYFVTGNDTTDCGSQSAPTLQNMQSNLIDIDNASSVASGILNGGYFANYWSSSEYSGNTFANAWSQTFNASSASTGQYFSGKYYHLGVRCVRGFING